MNDETPNRDAPLSPADADAVGIVVAQLAEMKLPLGEGLLAASREVGSRQLSRALKRLGRVVEQGASLSAALKSCGGILPPALAEALRAADKSGQIGPVLAEWTENQLAAQARSRQLRQALAYPAVCLLLALLVLSLIGWFLVPAFEEFFHDAALRIPSQLTVVHWLGKIALPLLGGAVAVAATLLFLSRILRVNWIWQRLVAPVPLIGKLWHWSSTAWSLRMLAILVEQRVPLPESLRLAAHSADSPTVARVLFRSAGNVEAGGTLSQSIEQSRLPRSLAPLLRAAERSGAIADGLRDGAALLEQRVVAQCDLVALIVPPLLFLIIGFAVLVLLGSLFGPLLQMIQGLSN